MVGGICPLGQLETTLELLQPFRAPREQLCAAGEASDRIWLITAGLVNWTARGVYFVGDWGRGIQTGRLRNYLMVLTVALIGLFAGVFAWVQS